MTNPNFKSSDMTGNPCQCQRINGELRCLSSCGEQASASRGGSSSIVPAAAGASVGCLLLIVVLFVVRRRSQRWKSKVANEHLQESMRQKVAETALRLFSRYYSELSEGRGNMLALMLSEHQLDPSNLQYDSATRGGWRNASYFAQRGAMSQPVSARSSGIGNSSAAVILTEARLLLCLDHEHITRCVGYIDTASIVANVIPRFSGSLKDHLKKLRTDGTIALSPSTI